MTLRKRTLLIIAGTFYGVIILLFFLSRNILLESFVKLEEQSTHQDVEQVLSALSNELSYLESVTWDRAAWDDTYAFIEDVNEEYIKSNLTDSTFTEIRLNLMMFIHSSGRAVFGKAFDLDNEEEIPVPQSLQKHLSANDLLLTHTDLESSITGIILLPESPMLVASCPILTSEDEGPIRGTLIMGRYLDATEIERLAEATRLSLTLHQFTDLPIPPDFQAAISSLSEETPILVQPLSEQTVAGYALITDIYGKPGLVLRADTPRDIYEQGQASVSYLIVSIVGVSLVFGVATILLLERQVLSRLSNLSKKVRSIGTSGDLSSRVSMQGADELTDLGATINGMLAALQQSESELRESEERHRAIFEQAAESIVLIDAETGILAEFNDRAHENLGYTSEEFEKLKIPDFEVIESAEEVAEHIEKIIKERTDVFETKHRTKDGEIRDVQVSSRVISIGGREFIQSIWRDVTERKQAEEKLQELYKEEKELRQELEAEINKRVEFTRALVHELKTPITPVLASSEMLLEELKEEHLLGLAQNICQGAYNLNQRIDELLDLARGEVGMLRLNPESVDPRQLLRGIADSVRPVALKNGQSLSSELPSSLPAIWADEDRLRQVVLNLINNAFKFTPAGGKITLRAKKDDTNLIVEVKDTGYGISEEEQQRLFEPYHQLESDRARLSGLGLGLSLSKKLVELHGGEIWVRSQKGKGSTFGFSIPLEATSRGEKVLKQVKNYESSYH